MTAGNMDSMINRCTADRKIRSDDAYTPGGPTAPPSSTASADNFFYSFFCQG